MITNKRQMYSLLNVGRLGNAFRSWDSWEEVLDSGYRGTMSVRSLTVGDPIREYDKSFERIQEVASSYPNPLIFYEATPNKTRVIQGEICRGYWGYNFTYTFVRLPMRVAFAEEQSYASGSATLYLLQTYVDSSSLDDIFGLLNRYPDHVVEFSTFCINVGKLQRPTVIWEVRKY